MTTQLGGLEDQKSLQAVDTPCGVPRARCWLHNTASFRNSVISVRNGGWALQTLGLFIMGPQAGSVWDTPGPPLGWARSSGGSALGPQSAQRSPTEWAV